MLLRFILLGGSLIGIIFVFDFLIPKLEAKYQRKKDEKIRKKIQPKSKNTLKELEIK